VDDVPARTLRNPRSRGIGHKSSVAAGLLIVQMVGAADELAATARQRGVRGMVEQALRRGIGIDNRGLMVKEEQGGGQGGDGDLEMRISRC
jgi:hypothetical protein